MAIKSIDKYGNPIKAGEYVQEDGEVVRFLSPIEPGAWEGEDSQGSIHLYTPFDLEKFKPYKRSGKQESKTVKIPRGRVTELRADPLTVRFHIDCSNLESKTAE